MASRFIPYQHTSKLAWSAGFDWLNDSIYAALVTASYTPLITHDEWGDVSANEVATGNGYTTGGLLLTGKELTVTKLSMTNPLWTTLTKTFRYVVFYKSGTVGGLINPLIGYLDYGDTVTVNGVNFTVVIPSTGLSALAQNIN